MGIHDKKQFIYCKLLQGKFFAELIEERKRESYYIVKKMDGSMLEVPFSLGEVYGTDDICISVGMKLLRTAENFYYARKKYVANINNIEDIGDLSPRQNEIFNKAKLAKEKTLHENYIDSKNELEELKTNLKFYDIYPTRRDLDSYATEREEMKNEFTKEIFKMVEL